MREKTIKKLAERVNREVDRDMKKKYGDSYKTRAEKSREARQSKKISEILDMIFLIQKLERSGLLTEQIIKLSNKQSSEFNKFLGYRKNERKKTTSSNNFRRV